MRYSDSLKYELARAIVKRLGLDQREVDLVSLIPRDDKYSELAIDDVLDVLIDKLELADLADHLLLTKD